MPRFNVTYEIVTPESAADGDAAGSGFEARHVTLREAVSACGFFGRPSPGAFEPSCAPLVCMAHYPAGVWFTTHGEQNYQDGSYTSYSIHVPRGITWASLRRVARVLGVKV